MLRRDYDGLENGWLRLLLTYMFDYVVDGWLEKFVHGFLGEPQHPLGRPLHDVHANEHKHGD